ncbi:sugar-binding transcriptional regulator [Pelagibacterium montanilacus]|uniref:sugar-binding transcriptional regulator n=1 Tax=Pelagibacterium montanilacus TaxID=2185280 RepID=UPI000F8EAF8A|nr:sugar-binding domain-containing protein [Pelagibacterium montanilacus]
MDRKPNALDQGGQDQQLRGLSTDQREGLMVRAAKLYYDLEHTQAEVGRMLGLNRFQVARLLRDARDTGIVRIEIVPRAARRPDLEARLQKEFGLADAVIVSAQAEDDAMLDWVAHAAADYLGGLNPNPRLIGVSWGRTMAAVAGQLADGWADGVEVVLLNGATHLRSVAAPSSNVAERFATTGRGSALLLPVPAIMGKAATRRAIEEDAVISTVLEKAANAPIACFGLGGMLVSSVLVESGYFDTQFVLELRGRGAVGDILGRVIDAKGRIVDPELDARTIGLGPERLREKELSIGVCCGQSKHAVANAAVRAGYINVLIADEATASFILENDHVL